MFTIKNKTRVLAAAAVMASSLVVLGASGVASSAAAAPKCYAVVNGAVKAAAPTTTSPLACPAGYQSSVSAAVLGTGLPGDAAASMPSGDSATLAMNGSSFVYPFVSSLVNGTFSENGISFSGLMATLNATPGGSGAGRKGVTNSSDATANTLAIGFSDQPMTTNYGGATLATAKVAGGDCTITDSALNTTAGTYEDPNCYTQLPDALGGAVVAYNLSGIAGIDLNGSLLTKIYNGDITSWADPAILAANNGGTACGVNAAGNLSKAPLVACGGVAAKLYKLYYTGRPTGITVLYRNAASGTTLMFEDYLWQNSGLANLPNATNTGATAAAINSHGPDGGIMYGAGYDAWAKGNSPTIQAVNGNSGMAASIQTTQGSIGYVEYGYVLANPGAIDIANLKDGAGHYIKPTLALIQAAATLGAANVNTDNFSLVNLTNSAKTADAWPIASYTWAIIKNCGANATTNGYAADTTFCPSNAQNEAATKFLAWLTHKGQSYAAANGFVPLPATVQANDTKILLGVKNADNSVSVLK